jgi:hypothetical protein
MPQVVIPAVITAGVAFAAETTVLGLSVLGSALVIGGASLVLGAISYALTPKPKSGGLSNQKGTVAVRQTDMTRCFVYGHTRTVKGYAHIEATGDNKFLHMFIILCDGPVRAINEVWVNDYSIPNDFLDANGKVVLGRYANRITIRKHLGTVNQGADAVAVSNLPNWTNQHRLQGIAYLYVILEKDINVFPNGVPNFSAIVEGLSTFDPRLGVSAWNTNTALFCRDFITNQRYGYGANTDDVNDDNIAAQANICDEIVDVTEESFRVNDPQVALNVLRLDGRVLTLQFGDRVRITSTGDLPSPLMEDTAYYAVPYQVLNFPRVGLATSFANAMNKVLINITDQGSGTIRLIKTGEPRYHASGVFDTEATLNRTLNDLTSSMAGRSINIAGAWTLLAGAWRTPTLALGEGDMRGVGMSVKNDLSMSDYYNVVRGLFSGPASNYQNTDYPMARYDQFIDEDLGIEQPKELNLPFTSRPTTAQRIAKIELFRGRQGIAMTSDFSLSAFQAQPGDVIDVNSVRMGWEEKPFEITELSLNFSPDGSIFTNLQLRETAQAIYDWSSGEAIFFDPAPNTNLPNAYDVIAPLGVSYNSRQIETEAGDIMFIIQLEWSEHPDSFVTQFGDYEIQFKESAVPDWLPSFFVDGSITKTDVVTASAGTAYDLRIRARNNLGVRSEWSTIFNAIAGASGGVVESEDWGLFSDSVSESEDWGLFSDSVSESEDWGYYG